MRTRLISLSFVAAGLALVMGACGGGSGGGGDNASSATPAPSESAPAALPTDPDSRVARASTDTVVVYETPDPGASTRPLAGQSDFGFRRAFLVLAEDGDFLHVLLPERPNGSTGWLRTADVEVESVSHRLEVDLAARTLRWFDDGDVVLETAVAIGSPEYPTPTGRFFVTDLLDTGDEAGGYGPYAAGLSGFSVLTEFAGGDGQIGIHGTNDPSSIGRDVSHGCVRVPNDVITRLANELPIGTPVTIAS